jgi:hypothetical protein
MSWSSSVCSSAVSILWLIPSYLLFSHSGFPLYKFDSGLCLCLACEWQIFFPLILSGALSQPKVTWMQSQAPPLHSPMNSVFSTRMSATPCWAPHSEQAWFQYSLQGRSEQSVIANEEHGNGAGARQEILPHMKLLCWAQVRGLCATHSQQANSSVTGSRMWASSGSRRALETPVLSQLDLLSP